jgi:O-antigen/teichoic acid export membrane protein
MHEDQGHHSHMSETIPLPTIVKAGSCQQDVNKLAKGAGISLLGNSFGKAMFFLIQLALAWLLGVENFGLYNLGLALVKIAEIVARLGLNTGGMRFVSVYKDSSPSKLKGIFISAAGIASLTATLIAAVIYFAASVIARDLFQKPDLCRTLQLFCLSIPLVALMNVTSSLFQGFHTMKFTVYMREIIQPSANFLLIIALAYAGFTLDGAILAYTLSHLFALIFAVPFLRKVFPQFFKRDLRPEYLVKPLLSYSAPLLFVGFLHYFLTWTDILMLGVFAPIGDVGIYRAASQIPFVMTLFLGATNSIYAPLAADLYQHREIQRLGTLLRTSTRWVTYITVPVFIFLVFSSSEIMTIFGKDYAGAGSVVLIILCFGQLSNCVTGGVGFTLTMTGRQNLELANSVVLVCASVALNLILIPKYGAVGTAIASSASTLGINVLRVIEVYLLYSLIPFSKVILSIGAPLLVSIAVILICDIKASYITTIIINIIIICVVFGFAMRFYLMEKEDRDIMNLVKNKIISRCKQ